LAQIGRQQGLSDVVDRGDGLTLTNFENAPGPMDRRTAGALTRVVPEAARCARVKVDSGFIPYWDDWAQVWGPAPADIQPARRNAGEGPGWVDRLEAALKAGVSLPVLAAAGVPVGALHLAQDREAPPAQ